MAGPAGGSGRIRASHADREQTIDVLKAAFVQGLLTKEELDTRVGQTFASRTYGDLAALAADLPAGLVTVPPPSRPPMSNAVKAAICVAIAAVTLVVAIYLGGVAALRLFVPFYGTALLVAGAQAFASWHDKRGGGQAPPRPPPRPGSQMAGSGR